jgi:hypothetical protein
MKRIVYPPEDGIWKPKHVGVINERNKNTA